MERKNTVLLTVIAVATLLVAVVGATFAYFTATTSDGTNSDVNGTTVNSAKVANVNLTMAPVSVQNKENVYPGVMVATGASVSAAYADEGDGGSNKVVYTLNASVDLTAFEGSSSTFTYSIYRSATNKEPIKSCEKKEEDSKLWYEGCAVDTDGLTAVDGHENQALTAGQTKTITVENEEVNVGSTIYYYLIVNYQNKSDSDQTDTDKDHSMILKIISATDGQIKQTA